MIPATALKILVKIFAMTQILVICQHSGTTTPIKVIKSINLDEDSEKDIYAYIEA
ncbi:8306_t:CDS:2, partial [Cetraspora pellucida]